MYSTEVTGWILSKKHKKPQLFFAAKKYHYILLIQPLSLLLSIFGNHFSFTQAFLKGKNKINLYSQILIALYDNLRGSVLKTGPHRRGNIKLMTEAESRTKNDQFVPAIPSYSHLEMNMYNNKRWDKWMKTYKLRCGYTDVDVVVTNLSCILYHSKKWFPLLTL